MTVAVTNPLDRSVIVHHIVEGEETSVIVAEVASGATVEIPAEAGAAIGFVQDGYPNWFGPIYTVRASERQQVGVSAPIYAGSGMVLVRLENYGGGEFGVFRLPDASGEQDGDEADPEPLGIIPAGRGLIFYGDAGMKLAFTSGNSFAGGFYTVPATGGTLRLPAPMRIGNGSVRVVASNGSGRPLSVTEVREGDTSFDVLGTVAPGQQADIFAPAGAKIGFSDLEGSVGGTYTVTSRNGQIAGLPLPFSVGDGSMSTTIENTSDKLISVNHVFTTSDVRELGMLRPKESAIVRSSPCTMLGFADGATGEWVGGMYQITRVNSQSVNVPPSSDSDPAKCAILTRQQIEEVVNWIAVEQAKLSMAEKAKDKFCWRDTTYRQGSVRLPDRCPSGTDDHVGLCGNQCRGSYDSVYNRNVWFTGNVTMCVPDCPPGFRDDGLSCWKPAPYTRKEYPVDFNEALKTFGSWFGGSKAGTGLSGAMARCRADANRAGKPTSVCIPANGDTIVYEKCRPGFHQAPFPPNVCTADCPSGMTDGGQNCWKNTYDRGVGRIKECAPGLEADGGLCYAACGAGYKGVGPVMLAANVAIIAGSLGTATGGVAAANVARTAATGAARTAASLATKAAAKAAAKVALKASVKASLKSAAKGAGKLFLKEIVIQGAIGSVLSGGIWGAMTEVQKKTAYDQIRAAYDARYTSGGEVDDAVVETVVNAAMEGAEKSKPAEDFPWDSLDPTGIASIVVAYNFSKCSDVENAN